ncbi:MAG: tRNA pseudouridine(55) synthase TruB [Phycisphaerae bacterium]|nr:tRNA pseudouridine(55) synthase TruB [Phycisphaerae bacterium]
MAHEAASTNEPARPSGILLVDKPRGMHATSMDVCRQVKGSLFRAGWPKSLKVGHAGTLDPLASGLVIVLVGKATRLCEGLMGGEKEYLAQVDLSMTSTTDDLEGVLSRVDVPSPPDAAAVRRALDAMTGTIMQRPPVHSAMKVDGRRAYTLARRGAIDELPARPVLVHAIDLIDCTFPGLTLRVRCGRGTYIRSLARDLGRSLGVGGVLVALRRTAIGPHRVERAVRLDALDREGVVGRLIPFDPEADAADGNEKGPPGGGP